MKELFSGLFDSEFSTTISVGTYLLCIAVALALGIVIALVHSYRTRYSRSFLVTLALVPAIVCVVIMMVNGNIGTGVAVAGAFSLVRFRSMPGTAREIGSIFLSMAAGLTIGMGYLAFAVLFVIVLCSMILLYQKIGLGIRRGMEKEKTLRITLPEDLDYTAIFNDVFEKYTTHCECVMVKTTNLGSLFRITYEIILKDASLEKEFMDELRCRNGNLEISIGRLEERTSEFL